MFRRDPICPFNDLGVEHAGIQVDQRGYIQVEKSETDGFMKVLVDAETKKIVGASFLEIECDEVIHSILDVMYANALYTVIQRAMHIHPTASELIPTMLGELEPLG
jgi:pyruvate/2-oxoglutarate dehydrogenase complex dihydrolipoamide dehydrogenase (E3) component